MEKAEKETIKEIATIILASIILAAAIAMFNQSYFLTAIIYFLIILTISTLAKKAIAYNLDASIRTKFWSIYHFGFRVDSHFKKPVPMFWVPLIISLISKTSLLWLAIIESDIKPKKHRVARRHGRHRFSEMTDWHTASITAIGVVSSLVLAIIGGIFNYPDFTKLSVYFALWSLVPISSLDGSKILFGSRIMWFILLIITLIFLASNILI